MMSSRFDKSFWRSWLAIVGSATILILLTYLMAQTSTRLSANEWPRFKGDEARNLLEQGMSPGGVILSTNANVAPNYKRDLTKTDSQFLIITDKNKQVLETTVTVNDQTPHVPDGVLDYATQHGKHEITWQPAANARETIYVIPYSYGDAGGFVITGQSLTETESHIKVYGTLAGIAWLAMVIWTTLILAWHRK